MVSDRQQLESSRRIAASRWHRRARGALGCIGVVCAAFIFMNRPTGAVDSPWARTNESAVRLISATTGVGDAGELRAGLEVQLEPGWKTYWRSPGDAGFPIGVDWAGSTNLAQATVAWPAPHRFTLFGLDTFGYEHQVVLPVALQPQQPGQPIGLRAKVDYLVCTDICIPHQAMLSLDLPAGAAQASPHVQLIDQFVARVPGDGARQGLRLEHVGIARDGERAALEVTARAELMPFDEPDLIVEAPAGLYFAAPDVALGEGGHVARFRLPVTIDAGAPPLDRAELTLTLVDGTRGLERRLVAAAGDGVASPQPAGPALLPMLLVALLGGLILNVMPCVLPVLSLKLLGLVGHGQDSRRVRLGFLASSAGIIATFLLLAAALVALQQAGETIGWGIQFQYPWFLVAMVLLLTLFAANLFGWFEVPLPASLGRAAGGGDGLGGQFVAGAFATLLATPCSAPFVGAAVGFALARGPAEIFAIFAALGVGLAAPYLLVAAVPGLARMLPRPGRWMVGLRRALGLLLAGTAVWLLTVLAAQIEARAALAVGALMLASAGALWARRRLPPRARIASPVAVGLLAFMAFLAAYDPGDSPVTARERNWSAFDAAAIPRLVGEGKTVFVDVTADWCLTCLVNKNLVVESSVIAARLADADVVAMQADWTRPNDAIARYLAAHGRYGIPFNAVYGPGAPDGILLPELLTEESVLDALGRAGG